MFDIKPQDILFLIVVALLLYKKNPHYFVYAGLICLFAAIPLFSFWIFFTAERLIYYATGFLFIALVMYLVKMRNN